jgi:hypothetical protein
VHFLSCPVRRGSPLVALSVIALAVSACGEGSPAVDATATDTARGQPSPAAVSSARTLPPKLYSERPSSDPTKWKEYAEAIAFSAQQGMTLERGCDGDHDHHGDCRLVISPALHSHNVGDADIDPFGFVVARIQNVGAKKEAFFGIEPGQIVLWRVFRRSAASSGGQPPFGQMASQFIDFETGLPIARPTHIPADKTYFDVPATFAENEFPFRKCPGSHPQSPVARARFVPCDASLKGHALDSLRALPEDLRSPSDVRTMIEALKPLTKHNSPAWIACLQGCCAVEEGGP